MPGKVRVFPKVETDVAGDAFPIVLSIHLNSLMCYLFSRTSQHKIGLHL